MFRCGDVQIDLSLQGRRHDKEDQKQKGNVDHRRDVKFDIIHMARSTHAALSVLVLEK